MVALLTGVLRGGAGYVRGGGILTSVAGQVWSSRWGRSKELEKERESPFHLLDPEVKIVYTVAELKHEVL
jgi:hypothetical protein